MTTIEKIRAELHATAEMHEDGDYYLRDKWVDEVIDKYAEQEPVEAEYAKQQKAYNEGFEDCRKAVIKVVDKHTFDTDYGLCLDDDISCILEQLPSVNTQEWIPVSERFPEESKRYMVSTKFGEVMTDFYTGTEFLQGSDIVAWAQLLEPYRAESEEKRNDTHF